jgi:hypothetical protein
MTSRQTILASLFLIIFCFTPIPIFATTSNSTGGVTSSNQDLINKNIKSVEANGTKPQPLLPGSSEHRTQVAFGFSALAIFLIFIVYIIFRLGDFKIIKDATGYPSLAKFQLLLWTIIVTFAFFGIYLTRIFEGVLTPPPMIPTNLLTLMGISVIVPALNKKASAYRYGIAHPPAPDGTKTVSMLQENNTLELTRLQMFSWTLVSITIYLLLLYSTVVSKMGDAQNLILPDIDGTLVVLMGLSQAGYLGGKIAH